MTTINKMAVEETKLKRLLIEKKSTKSKKSDKYPAVLKVVKRHKMYNKFFAQKIYFFVQRFMEIDNINNTANPLVHVKIQHFVIKKGNSYLNHSNE